MAVSPLINCDFGESFGRYTLGHDAALAPLVHLANLACGAHAGDPGVMRASVRLCVAHGVRIGAHVSYPDLQGFGRRALALPPNEVTDWTLYQLGALAAFAHVEGASLHHLKPHGALYNVAMTEPATAAALAQAVHVFDANLAVLALPGSALAQAAAALGLRVLREGFPDRGYAPHGTLLPRHLPGAVLTDPLAVAAQAHLLIQKGVDTLCIHGDGPHAVRFAQVVRELVDSV